jgi:alpha-mannosidase/mannosylglycerate hydrolase
MNGADHTFTSPDLAGKIEQLEKEISGVKFRQSLMSEYINAHNKEMITGKISGEQRDPSKIFILPGVYSTRSYLKVQNQMCEDQAIGIMEALNVWTNGKDDSKEFINYVWKLILQNQPHDSICGCSVDEVHNEMETRTQKVLSAIQQFSRDTLNDQFPFEFLDPSIENPYLYLVNNIPISDIYPVRSRIRIPKGLDLGSIKLFHQDHEIDFDIIKRESCEEFIHHILAEPHYAEYVIYDVAFHLPFDGVEMKSVRIQRIEEEAEVVKNQLSDWIENEYYKIHWNDHGLIITDKETGKIHDNQNTFMSSLDAGDSYNYSPPVNDLCSIAKLKCVSNVNIGKTYQSVTIHYEMEMPASLNHERYGPSSERVVNKIETVVTLYKGKNLINFNTKVENHAKDQKLRVGFATSEANISYADTAFDLLQRKTLRNKKYDVAKNKEAIMNQYPTYSTVFVNDHQIVHRGLQEYEVDQYEGKDSVFLTMIRGVGWLSRRDLRTRGNGAGPGFETPGAQCLGAYEYEYGLVMGNKHRSLNHAKMMRQPILVQQSFKMVETQKLFRQSSQKIAFSSFISKKENTFDIRMFNPFNREVSTKIYFGFEPEEVVEVDFTGQRFMGYPTEDELTITFKPKQIKTIRVCRKAVLY